MAKFKDGCKRVWKWIWECIKHSIMPLVMYITCSIAMAMFAFSVQGSEVHWAYGTPARYLICVGVGLVPLVYQGLLAFFLGANGYDMLVAGNMKRMTYEGEVRMSSHKEEKEYRVWKGFAIGVIASLITVFVAILWGCNQQGIQQLLAPEGTAPNKWTGVVFLAGLGWSWAVVPFMFINGSAGTLVVPYFLSIFFAVLPIVVSGVFYIIGAYSRRRKRLAKLDAEEKALAEKEARKQKVNYGGLPGTKPNKKK